MGAGYGDAARELLSAKTFYFRFLQGGATASGSKGLDNRGMFLKAGLVSLFLLLASRVLGLLRETALAATFGSSGLGDVAVLMLTLPDWLAGLLASGALAYVLLPHWAQQDARTVALSQRAVARWLLGASVVLAVALWWWREPAVSWLASGLSADRRGDAFRALAWSALALPPALLAALWTTRLQRERDFIGMYGANLVVNGVLILALWLMAACVAGAACAVVGDAVSGVGVGLMCAMGLRALWLKWRLRAHTVPMAAEPTVHVVSIATPMPRANMWLWAALAAGLPLTLPFAARSLASQGGEGALAIFNYAWKLVELPLVLAVQLVATLAFPSITQAFANDADRRGASAGFDPANSQARVSVRAAFVLAWTLACAAAAGLLVAAPAAAQLLFGWGRMGPQALERVAAWGAAGAWGLLPQALIAVALTVLATLGNLRVAVAAYALALTALLVAGMSVGGDGVRLMRWMNLAFTLVAGMVLAALGPAVRHWLPWRSMVATGATLGALALGLLWAGWPVARLGTAAGLGLGSGAALVVVAIAWLSGTDLRQALRR